MAENKKKVILYCDIITTVEKLKDADAGKLFKHYLRYINDLEPVSPSPLIEIVFEPIKQTLKRDLKSYEDKCARNKEIADERWAKNNLGKVPKDTNAYERIKKVPKNADTDNGTDTDNDTDTGIDIEIKKEEVRSNVFLHRKEIEKLKTQYTDVDIGWMYDKLSAYKLSKGKKYKSDYGAILSWVTDKLKEEKEKNSAKKENGTSKQIGTKAGQQHPLQNLDRLSNDLLQSATSGDG